jgi:hypothetical protein
MKELADFGAIPIDSATLYQQLSTYKSPKDKVSRLEHAGNLIRLKKGLFLVSPDISKQEISTDLIANHLYGPSYVSYERSLFLHSLIPERVYLIKSAIANRKKNFATPVGEFSYTTVREDYYSIGLQLKIINNTLAFILASPEKAICDLILATSGLRFQSARSIEKYLLEDLRIDFEQYAEWNPSIIKECMLYSYKKKELELFYKFVYHEFSI